MHQFEDWCMVTALTFDRCPAGILSLLVFYTSGARLHCVPLIVAFYNLFFLTFEK
jgi:hypothetical protein